MRTLNGIRVFHFFTHSEYMVSELRFSTAATPLHLCFTFLCPSAPLNRRRPICRHHLFPSFHHHPPSSTAADLLLARLLLARLPRARLLKLLRAQLLELLRARLLELLLCARLPRARLLRARLLLACPAASSILAAGCFSVYVNVLASFT
ncbi:hypothetical protein Droror1_Dr00023774 [Drosera rotundifolia]